MVLTLPDVGGQLIVVLSLRLDCEVVVPLLLLVGHLELLDPPQHRAVVGLSGLSANLGAQVVCLLSHAGHDLLASLVSFRRSFWLSPWRVLADVILRWQLWGVPRLLLDLAGVLWSGRSLGDLGFGLRPCSWGLGLRSNGLVLPGDERRGFRGSSLRQLLADHVVVLAVPLLLRRACSGRSPDLLVWRVLQLLLLHHVPCRL